MKWTGYFVLLIVTLLPAASAPAATIATVPVVNPGNAPDTRYDPSGFGSVSYNYRIGKYEVTNAQYAEFLNGVDPMGVNTLELYKRRMSSDGVGGINFNRGAANGSKYEIKPGRDNNPVIFVSWYDAIRFANWLHNGQGSGDTENGAYTLLGGTPVPTNGDSITRNPDAKWWLPSEDEWYKAAYHKNDGVTGNYWDYPTSTDAIPYSDQPPGGDAPDPRNTANVRWDDGVPNGYDDGFAVTGSTSFLSAQNYLTDVGNYIDSPSPYGTFDQGGNVWEWSEALFIGSESFRGTRGGSWEYEPIYLGPMYQGSSISSIGVNDVGFRVAGIPEPNTTCLGVLGVVVVLWLRRGRS